MTQTINQVEFPKVFICGPSGYVADVDSGGHLLTTGGGGSTNVIDGVTVTGTPSANQVLTATSPTAANWQTPAGGAASTLRLAVTALPGPTSAIAPHTPATYVVTEVAVNAMTLAVPTVTTDDGVVIKITLGTSAAHTLTCASTSLRCGTAAITTVNFASYYGSSIELMAYQGLWYVMAQNNIASF